MPGEGKQAPSPVHSGAEVLGISLFRKVRQLAMFEAMRLVLDRQGPAGCEAPQSEPKRNRECENFRQPTSSRNTGQAS